eukprot:1002099-Rhodomonas_salina.1
MPFAPPSPPSRSSAPPPSVRVQGSTLQGSGFTVQGSGLRVEYLKLMVWRGRFRVLEHHLLWWLGWAVHRLLADPKPHTPNPNPKP